MSSLPFLVVGLGGTSGAGKSTAAAGLARFGFARASFADALREFCLQLRFNTEDSLQAQVELWPDDLQSFKDQEFDAPLKVTSIPNRAVATAALTKLVGVIYEGERKEAVTDLAEVLSRHTYTSGRHLLQIVGTEVFREKAGADFWVRLMEKRLQRTGVPTVIDDMRFPNERAAVRAWGGVGVLVTRPGYEPRNHPSDLNLGDPVEYHGTLVNDSTIADLHFMVSYAVTKELYNRDILNT